MSQVGEYIHPIIPPCPAPGYIPERNSGVHQKDLPTLQNITHCMTYLWRKEGDALWSYPVRYQDGLLHGYGWNGQAWEPLQIPTPEIESFF